MALPNEERFELSRFHRAMKRHVSPAGRRGGELYVAVVHARDGVRLAEAASSRAELVSRLAEYVRWRAAHLLRADHARHVRALLARGELEAAVEVYFRLVGERWDEEWLVTASLEDDAGAVVGAALDAVTPTSRPMIRSREA